MRRAFRAILSLGLLISAGSWNLVSAEIVLFDPAGDGYAASAIFSLTGQNLEITLRNTFSAGSDFEFIQTDVLTGIFFNIDGNPTLTPVSAALTSGSTILLDGVDITTSETENEPFSEGDVGAAWAYKAGAFSGLVQTYGIAAAGEDIFGSNELFHPGRKLTHQQALPPDGVDFGLMPLDTNNFSHDRFDDKPFIQNGVTFKFTDFTGSLADISNVRFQYGTSTAEFSVTVVPEPSGAVVLIAPTLAILFWRPSCHWPPRGTGMILPSPGCTQATVHGAILRPCALFLRIPRAGVESATIPPPTGNCHQPRPAVMVRIRIFKSIAPSKPR